MRKLTILAAMLVCLGNASADPVQDLKAADKAFSDLSVAKGSNTAFLAYIADDAILFGTGDEAPIRGKAAAIMRFTTEGNGDPKTNVLSWTPEDAGADGALGWTAGVWMFNGIDGKGAALKLTGHYLTVWKKDSQDAWKVQADMGTTDPAPAK